MTIDLSTASPPQPQLQFQLPTQSYTHAYPPPDFDFEDDPPRDSDPGEPWLSPLPVELLQAIVALLPEDDLVRLLRVNSFFHAAVVKLVYVRVPAVVLRRQRKRRAGGPGGAGCATPAKPGKGVHARPPLKNAHYAAHVRCLDAGMMARRCCRPWGRLKLPALEVLRLDVAPHAPHPFDHKRHVRTRICDGAGAAGAFGPHGAPGYGHGCKLPSGLRARTVVLRSVGRGLGRRVDEAVMAGAERLVLFLRMPGSVFDMEPVPLTFAKEVPGCAAALTVVLECPRQPDLAVDVLHALFQLCECVDATGFSDNYPRLGSVTVVVPDYILGRECKEMVQGEVKRYRMEGRMGDVRIAVMLASEFLASREYELVLSRREAGEYWRRSRPSPRSAHAPDGISELAGQARRLLELAGLVWNTLIDDYAIREDEIDDDGYLDDPFGGGWFGGHGLGPGHLVVF